MSAIAVVLPTAVPEGPMGDGAALTKIDGRESVLRVMEMYTNREGVAQTTVVVDEKHAEAYKKQIGSHLMFMGIKILSAAAGWYDQLAAMEAKFVGEIERVIVHDAARPAVPFSDIDALLRAGESHEAVALAQPLRGTMLNVGPTAGGAKVYDGRVAVLQSPMIYSRAAFATLVVERKLPTDLQWIEGSVLNQRCGWVEPAVMKGMINLLPKPKMKAATSPFEEAQW